LYSVYSRAQRSKHLQKERPYSEHFKFPHPLKGGSEFVYLDVGCSGGFADKWLGLGELAKLVGFDPLVYEIMRLQRSAQSNHTFECAFIIGDKTGIRDELASKSFQMTTAAAANNQLVGQGSSYIEQEFNGGTEARYSDIEVSLDDFFASPIWSGVRPNFLKTDTDGFDFSVLEGAKGILGSDELVGVEIECLFHGDPSNPRASTFSNIDVFLRSLGFTLYRIEPHTYSRTALPSAFVYDIGAQTDQGTVQWADAVYFRDPFLSPGFRAALDASPDLRSKYLVALRVLEFDDVFAQALTEFPEDYFPGVDAKVELNRLVQGNRVGATNYAELIHLFHADFRTFFPSRLKTEKSGADRHVLMRKMHEIRTALRKLIKNPSVSGR
jgi:hypothetical protein